MIEWPQAGREVEAGDHVRDRKRPNKTGTVLDVSDIPAGAVSSSHGSDATDILPQLTDQQSSKVSHGPRESILRDFGPSHCCLRTVTKTSCLITTKLQNNLRSGTEPQRTHATVHDYRPNSTAPTC